MQENTSILLTILSELEWSVKLPSVMLQPVRYLTYTGCWWPSEFLLNSYQFYPMFSPLHNGETYSFTKNFTKHYKDHMKLLMHNNRKQKFPQNNKLFLYTLRIHFIKYFVQWLLHCLMVMVKNTLWGSQLEGGTLLF